MVNQPFLLIWLCLFTLKTKTYLKLKLMETFSEHLTTMKMLASKNVIASQFNPDVVF